MLKRFLGIGCMLAMFSGAPATAQSSGRAQSGQVYRVEANSDLAQIFQRLLDQTARKDVPYQLLIEDDPSTVNAYSLGDGRVVVDTGLLNHLPAQYKRDAIAFVLAHELTHVEQRHLEQSNTQSTVTNLALGWLLGNQSEALQTVAGLGSNLIQSGSSRGMEAEADRGGLEKMTRAGFNPRGALAALALFRDLEAQQGGVRIFPDHPGAADRYNDTLQFMKENNYPLP